MHTFLALMVLFYVWRWQDVFPILGKLQLVSLSNLGAIGFFLIGPHMQRLPTVFKTPLFKLTFFILLLMCGSVIGGIYPGNAFRFIYQDHIKTFLFMVMLMATLSSVRVLERFVVINVVGAAVYCTWIILNVRMEGGRLIGGRYYDANDIAMVIVCTLPLSIYLLVKSKWLVKLLTLAGIAAMFITFVRTGSRGGFLGLAAAALFMLFRAQAISARTRVLAVVVGFAALVVLGGDQYWELQRSLLNPTEDYNWTGNASSGRMEVWKRGFGYMMERPLLGVGANNFYQAEGLISEMSEFRELGRGFKWSAAHNSFVQIGAELGVFGLLAFVVMLFKAYRAARGEKKTRREPLHRQSVLESLGIVYACSFVAFAVSGFFLSQAYAAYLYMQLACVTALALLRPAHEQAAGLSAVPAGGQRQQMRPRGRGGLVVAPR